MSSNRNIYLLAGAVFILNVILKMWTAHFPSLYLDEAASIFHAQMDWDGFQEFLGRDANPPFYYLLLRAWMSVFGDGVVATRFLSILFSALTAGLLVLLGKRHLNVQSGILAAVLFTFSNVQFHYSQEVRCFALVGFLVVLSFYFYLGIVRENRKSDFWGLCIVNFFLLTTHYAALPVIVMEFLGIFLWLGKSKRAVLSYLGSQLIAGLASLPLLLLLISSEKMDSTGKWLQSPVWVDFILKIMVLGAGTTLLLFIAINIVLGLRLYRYILAREKPLGGDETRTMVTLLMLGPATLFTAWLISQSVPIFHTKYILYSGIGWMIAGSWAILDVAPSPKGKVLVVIGVLMISVSQFKFRQQKSQDWQSAAIVSKTLQEDGAILISPAWELKTYAYYYDKAAFRKPDSITQLLYANKVFGLMQLDEEFFQYQKHHRYVLIQSQVNHIDPEDISYKMLDDRFQLIKTQWFKGLRMTVFGLDTIVEIESY